MSEEIAPLAVPTSVKARRKALKWSQERLGQEAGISTTAVHNLEAGKNGFTDKTLASLAKALGCTPAELLMPMDANTAQPIVGDAAIFDVLARIEGLDQRGRELAMMAITTALAVNQETKSKSNVSDDRSGIATPHRESEPSQ